MQAMTDKTFLRWAAAAGIGLVVCVSAVAALSGSNGDRVAGRMAAVAAIGQSGMSAMGFVDQGLAAILPMLAGEAVGPRFDAVSRDLFDRADDVRALVLYRSAATREEANRLAQSVSEGVVEFRAGGRVFYLAPANITVTGGRDNGFPRVGAGGALPEPLAAGREMQRALGTALSRDAPVSSALFGWEGDAVRPLPEMRIGAPGERVFWRIMPLRRVDPATGRDTLVGAAAALIDARTMLSRIAPAPATLSGPVDRVALPEGIRDAEGGALAIGIPTGDQGFLVTVPGIAAEDGSWLSWLAGLLLGGGAAAGVVLVTRQEAEGRLEAERRLRKNNRVFKKRSAELKRSEERFRRLAESTNVIPWAADLSTQRFTYIGPQVAKMSGYPVDSWCAPGFWVGHVHPEDRHKTFVDGLKGLSSGEYTMLEYRIRSADGVVIHIRNMLTISARRDGTSIAQGYMLDITEMKTAQAKLDDARRQAEEANRTKSEFLANMSHELRTPLNAVIGFAEVMKDELFGPMGDRYKDYAESVHSSGKHLLDLINDVLDLSKIEAGKIELIEEETDLGSLLSKCRTVLHERASSAGLHIRLEIPAPLPNVIVDSRRMKQVILNLMSNAIKFTMPGGRITLRGELKAPKGLVVTVADTGIGMTKEETAIAFEQFGQIDNELSRNHSGTGLGLPITRSLVELHGGDLEIESRKGVGTSAHVWLPLTRVVSLNAAKGGAKAKAAG